MRPWTTNLPRFWSLLSLPLLLSTLVGNFTQSAWAEMPACEPAATADPPEILSPNILLPNILLIVSDDHAWSDYGFMGHPHLRTPNLDRLESESLAFRRGYVPSSLCCPSLATLLTGRYPHQHKITSNDPPLVPGLTGRAFQSSEHFLAGRRRMNEHLQQVDTLPRMLARHGYLSLQTGKWWQGDFSQGGFTHGMTRGNRHGDEGLAIGRTTMAPIEKFLDDASDANKPWMIWYAPMMPHDPHTPPKEFLERTLPLAPTEHVARYWAMVEWFDATVGQLLSSLEARGQAENTLVVYIADNGWIQDPDRPRYAPKSKQSPYDGGLRTPILLRWPKRIQPSRSEALAQSIDVFPTIASAIGESIADDLPGIDLLSPESLAQRNTLYGECFTHNAIDLNQPRANLRWRWILRDSWKLIVPDAKNEPKARVELYDLNADPWETENRCDEFPERVKELRGSLDRWW